MSWLHRLRRALFPSAVVVSFATAEEELVRDMLAEVRTLIPDRRHFLVRTNPGQPVPGIETITLPDRDIYLHLRRKFAGMRIGMAPVLFTSDPRHKPLRAAACALAPGKILAYNARLERHHLQGRCPIASLLFFLGTPLDRIWLRPRWWPGGEKSTVQDTVRILDGRPLSLLRGRVAVLSPYFPYPLSHGGAVRIFHLLREASLSHDIFLFAFTERESEQDFAPLIEFCAKLILVEKPRYRQPRWASFHPPEVCEYRSPAMARALREVRAKFDIPALQTEYTQLASYGGDVLVEHDITFDLYRQIHCRQPGLSTWWNHWRWRQFERRALRRAAVAVVMSDKDAALSGHGRALVIANGVDLEKFQPSPEPPTQRVLFIGSFRHFPNVQAFQFLIDEVWPLVRGACPRAELTVVAGPDPLPHWQSHTGNRHIRAVTGMRLLEYIADVHPLYQHTNLVVAPTLVSAGTNIKVLEAMSMARAVVSTPSGCDGLGLKHKESVWIAEGPHAFATCLVQLLEDAALRNKTGAAARLHAEKHFSWRRLGAAQSRLWEELSPSPLRIRPMGTPDLDSVARIQEASAQTPAWPPLDYLSHRSTVAEHDNRICGFLVVRQTTPGEWEILNLAVAPSWRRQGVASRLLQEVLEQVRGEMFLEVRQSNHAARELYRRYRFEETGERPGYYQGPPESAIVMKRRS